MHSDWLARSRPVTNGAQIRYYYPSFLSTLFCRQLRPCFICTLLKLFLYFFFKLQKNMHMILLNGAVSSPESRESTEDVMIRALE